jgi:hypothetical protein
MQGHRKHAVRAAARSVLGTLAASLALAAPSPASAQSGPWAVCPTGIEVDTETSFGAPHLAGYGGAVTPELLQAVAFVALTRPAQRPAVDAIVTSRLRASGVQLDPNDWLALRDSATRGVDDHAGTRGFLYGLISGFSRTIVPGIFLRNDSGKYFARDVVDVDARECVLWPIIDELIKSPCETTAARALYRAASANREAARNCIPPPTQGSGLQMVGLKSAQGGGLKVSIARESAKPGASAEFRVSRSASPADRSRVVVWVGNAMIRGGATPTAPHDAIVAPGLALKADESRPFLVVEATRSRTSVSCEQPLPRWLARHEGPTPNGLHGPYAKISDVIADDLAGPLALTLTGSGFDEYGFVILRDRREKTGAFYTTPPVPTSQTMEWYEYLVSAPSFPWNDYLRSWQHAFSDSCADIEDFYLWATVHTHPYPGPQFPPVANHTMSPADIEQAFQLKRLDPEFQMIFMIYPKDRKLRMFVPKPGETVKEVWTYPP